MLRFVVAIAVCFVGVTQVFAGETISLSYAWQPGMYAKASGYQSNEKYANGDLHSSLRIDLSYIMSTREHAQGMQVDFLDAKTAVVSSSNTLPEWMKAYTEAVSQAVPSYVVSPAGELIGVVGLSELKQQLLQGLDPLLESLPAAQAEALSSSLQQAFSEPGLHQSLLSEWNMIVGQWLGAKLDAGDLYQLEFDTPVALLEDEPVRTRAEYRFLERVNCNALDLTQSCVRLSYRSQTDDLSVQALMEKLLPEDSPLISMPISHRVDLELIVDPDTLLTYYKKEISSAVSPVETPQGLVSVRSVKTSEYDFLYVLGV